jgi:hypothetical protein
VFKTNAMGDFFSIAAIVLLVLLGPWFLVWRSSSRRKREREEDQERWRELTSRTFALERTVRELQAQRSSRPAPTEEEATPKTAEKPAAASHTPAFSSPSIVSTPTQQVVSPHTEPAPEPSPFFRKRRRDESLLRSLVQGVKLGEMEEHSF